MDDETQKIISDQLKSLPKDVKEAILSVDYKTKLQEITKRQRLLIDQAGKLEMETTLVMIGLEPLTDYVANVERELAVPEARAKEIAQDVSDSVFKPIRESLRMMNEQVEEESKKEDDLENTNEPPAPRFTNSNETTLNRDQILKEIEDPSTIEKGDQKMNFTTSTELEIRPNQELETLPGQEAKDISKPADIVQAKMTGPTVVPRQIVDAKPGVKLPAVEKKRPYSGADPYREPLI